MSKQKRIRGDLYRLSLNAKQRMKMGYWTEVRELREDEKRQAEEHGKNPDAIVDYYRTHLTREFAVTKNVVNQEDDALYLKVCNILNSDEDAINPIGQLLDRDKYDSLDANGKQRYIVMLSAKYRELAERYFQEKNRKPNLH